MDTSQAKAFVNKRFKELTKQFPKFDNQYKVNLLLKELRVKHNFVTTIFSRHHSSHLRVQSVEFPANGSIVTFNFY